MSNNRWICTDPDNGQFGKQISKTIFKFAQVKDGEDVDTFVKEAGEHYDDNHFTPDNFVIAEIDLSEYTNEDKLEAMISYGYESKTNMVRIYGEEADFVLAECLFELNIHQFE